MKRVYLLTGRPGTGKTSIIKQVVAGMRDRVGGFYTEEVRSGGVRMGFRLVTLDGESAILSHVNIHSQYRVSKYGVDIDNLERVGISALNRAAREHDLVIIDEIGKMELFSASFREAVMQIIDSGKRVLGTIMLSPNPWTDTLKRHPQVRLIEVTRANNRHVLQELRQWLNVSNEERD
jgi:nucleoside-triphosphatase